MTCGFTSTLVLINKKFSCEETVIDKDW